MSSSAPESEAPFSQNIVCGILEGLKSQRGSSDFADVVVVISNFEFKCYRVLLAACSSFFKALLSCGMKEDLERKVELKEISKETFSDILDCIYTGRNILNEQNMFEIWHGANQLQIHFLLKESEAFVKQKITPENCLAIYQNSKLLDASDITQFSWSYILKNFENVRRNEDILMFTEDEIKKLIASQNLETYSEDGVLETILEWIAYIPPDAGRYPESGCEKCKKKFETTQECFNSSDSFYSESQDKPLLDSKQGPHDYDASFLPNAQVNKCDCVTKRLDRSKHLCDLMKAARICLLSGKCLLDALKNDHIRADKKAQEFLEEGLQYHLCGDKHHDFCPSSAVHRSSSNFENVIVGIKKGSRSEILVCRKQDGTLYGFTNPKSGYVRTYSAISFNNNIYVAVDGRQTYVFYMLTNKWKEFPQLTIPENVSQFLAVGNFLFAVHEDQFHSIEMINVKEYNGLSYGGKWIKVGKLCLESMIITCTTVVGDKIIFFGSIPEKPEIRVVVFDTASFLCSELNSVPFLSPITASFSKCQDSFVLQNNGILYRIRASPIPPFIEMKEEIMLWDFDRVLKGAVLFNDELLLFGPHFLLK